MAARRRRRAGVWLWVAVTAALAISAQAADFGWGVVGTIGTAPDEITVLYVGGTPYQMGWWQGQLLGPQVEANVATMLGGSDFAGITEAEWDGYLALLWPHVPAEYDEEIHGLADGAGVAYRDLQKMHLAGDISEYHCSNFCAFGTATADGRMLQIRILDWAMDCGIQDHPLITVYHPNGGIRHVNVGFAGFAGSITGINADHVAMGEMGDNFEPSHETLDGEPLVFLMRDVIAKAHNYAQAYAIIQNAPRTSSLWYVVGDSMTPDAGLFQTGMDIFNVWGPGQMAPPYPAIADCVYGGMYMERLYADLAASYGTMTPETAIAIARNNGSADGNLLSAVYDVSNLQLWAAYAEGPTSALNQEFVPFDFSKRIYTFDDVTPASSLWPYVEALAGAGVTGGCSGNPPRYCPGGSVSRVQMAKFLCLAAGKGPLDSATPTFADVPKTCWAYGYVERLADAASWGWNPPTDGCLVSGGTKYFCPYEAVTREQMAKFLCVAAGKGPMPSCAGVFSDVYAGGWTCAYIERLADGASWGGTPVTSGCICPGGYPGGARCYCPKANITRGGMAVFLVRAFGIGL